MAEYTKDGTSRFVDTPEWRLHFHDIGEGFPIIMIHGSGAGATGWANFHRNIDPFVDAGYRVILMDCPGFGLSSEVMTLEERFVMNGRAIAALMDALELPQAHLVGNSMGGGSALALVTSQPEKVGKLILMGSGGVGRNSIFTPLPMEGIKLLFDVYRDPSMENLKKMLNVFVYDPSALTEELIEFRHKSILANPNHLKNYLDSVEKSGFKMGDFTNQLADIKSPTLITWGRDDRFVPIDWSLKLLNMIPDSRLHVFSQCGHWAQWEHADAFNRLVLDFLEN